MSGSKIFAFTYSVIACGTALQCLPASAESNYEKLTLEGHSLHSPNTLGIWHESPLASQIIDQLVIRNWESLNHKSEIDWSNQISDLALNIASNKLSNYATKTIQKFPFVLGASINLDIRSEGTTNAGGDVLFKIADFGLKDDETRDGLAFLHTKYTGSFSNDSTWNAGLGLRHLIGEEMLAGINGYWDYRTTNYSTSHSRFGLGGELFWKTLSLTNNWYIAGTGTKTVKPNNNTEYYERVVPGWDIELGYRLPSNPNIALFARGFRWDYREHSDNTGFQGTVSYQMTPHVRVDSWISNEIPANPTQSNNDLDDDVVIGINFTLTSNPVVYKANNIKQMLQQEMIKPVRRRYDVLLERWAKTGSFTNSVGGS